jgi:CspA family cold shock protein
MINDVRSTGTVRHWYREEGWGVLDSSDAPGGCFAHFSNISGVEGYRELVEGETVEFDCQPTAYPGSQDGYSFRAIEIVRPHKS